MKLLQRISGLMTADIDHLLGQVEDPELTIMQLICDMEESIVDLRRETVTAVAHQGRLRQPFFAAEEASKGVELQATLAWQRGDELEARQILGRKIATLKTRDDLETALAEASGRSARLVASLIRMEDRAQLARRKRDELVRRRRTAAVERLSRHPHPLPGSGAFAGYAETVTVLEAEASRDAGTEPDPAEDGRASCGDMGGGGRC